ncbi:MAG: DUF362 domain-containing protein [Polyangiaceae bacterium]
MTRSIDRRQLLKATLATAAGATLLGTSERAEAQRKGWAATPPAGFQRLSLPGKVVKVSKGGVMQPGDVYPEPNAARIMLERAMTELTGKSSLKEALSLFVHPDDEVALKPNGIAGRQTMKMATSKELTVAVVNGLLEVGVKPDKITIFEQYRDFLYATRLITDKIGLTPTEELPAGIKMAVHLNRDATMESIDVGGTPTKYVTPFTNASVVINLSQVKDHSICGYTGAMKNITHGCNINPHSFHAHNASPQIAHLYAQDVIKSRVALHITDAYQVIYDEGPIDVNPRKRVLHEALYVATDPVALDVIGHKAIEKLRAENGLPTLADAGRAPTYIRAAGELGLGIYDDNLIRFRDVSI